MDSRPQPSRPSWEAALITRPMIESGVAELNQRAERQECGLLENEPALHEFLEAKVLQLAGKLAMGEAPPEAVQGVAVVVH